MTARQRLTELKVGGRVLRAGDQVKITGLRGLFRIDHVEVFPEAPERPAEFTLYGGGSRQGWRTVTADRIGTRKAMAGKGDR